MFDIFRVKRRIVAPLVQTGAMKKKKKYPSFPLSNKKILDKVQLIIHLVETCIYALPFLQTRRVDEEDSHSVKPGSIDEIKEKLTKKAYATTDEIFDDMEEVFESGNERNMKEMAFTLDNDKIQIKDGINADDIKRMGKEMIGKLSFWTKTNFVLDETMEDRTAASARKILDAMLKQFPDVPEDELTLKACEVKAFDALLKRFPHVSEEELKVQAHEVAHSNEDVREKIVKALTQKNENKKPDAVYQKFSFTPSHHLELDGKHAIHMYIAGYQFYRMMMKWAEPGASFPVPLRKVENAHDAIASIDYIRNPQIEEEYEAQKKRFENEGKQVAETLLFHGTAVANVDSILKNNFSLDQSPKQEQGSNRKKKELFGEGIYFSEMPAVSLMYGNGLVLCRVILGDCETFTPLHSTVQPDIPAQFDSREVKARDGSGVIHVVKRPAQVLPYCIIQLKNEALSSEYRKPTVSPLPEAASNLKTVTADPTKSTSKKEQVQATMDTFTKPEAPIAKNLKDVEASVAELPTCPICLEVLISDVVSLPCLHQLHATCARANVENGQGGPGCLQCPECQTIHGTRTGNQPREGDMTWTRLDSSLSGHPECGTIVIRYRFKAGMQDAEHPNPGKAYQAPGFPRVAYLPDSTAGQKVLHGLCTAFRRRLLFTVGESLTLGLSDCVVWAGIHHKTMVEGGLHGYPDPGYLPRVLQELNERGITDQDL